MGGSRSAIIPTPLLGNFFHSVTLRSSTEYVRAIVADGQVFKASERMSWDKMIQERRWFGKFIYTKKGRRNRS